VLSRDSLEVLEDTPIVTMRIHAVNGRDLAALRKDGDATWAHAREYRSTYRSYINEAESLVDGTWVPTWEPAPAGTGAPIPISVEEDVAADLKVGLGDTLDISIQGIIIPTVVSSLRRVDWGRFQTNFFLVFPDGSLDGVPQTRVMLTRAGSDEQVSRVQSQVTEAFPNVSSIDLRAILETAETILSRVADVLRFMALFSLGTGLLVLIGSVSVTRLQRLQEGALLKTLGAARRQVTQILLWEYAMLGGAAALAGLIPAYGASWALAVWVFEAPFAASLHVVPVTVLVVAGLTIGVGLFGTGRRYNRPTLELLRMDEG
jgi:putative ABC transport system permease protein